MKPPITAFLSLLVVGTALAAQPPLRINALVDKANAVVNVDEGDVCSVNIDKERKGLCAKTSDFQGKKLQVMAAFSDSVTDTVLAPLRSESGLSGAVQCKRVRMGTLPDIPGMPPLVIAEECTIKALRKK